jgi:hypothetical protein
VLDNGKQGVSAAHTTVTFKDQWRLSPDSFGISKDAFLIDLNGAPCMKGKN